MVFTDELGNDVNDDTLKNEIITLRDEKKSCIFFVCFESKGKNIPWEKTFGDVGNVIKIKMGSLSQIQAKVDEAMKEILNGTKDCSVCQEETCSASSGSTTITKAPPATTTITPSSTTTKAPTTTTKKPTKTTKKPTKTTKKPIRTKKTTKKQQKQQKSISTTPTTSTTGCPKKNCV